MKLLMVTCLKEYQKAVREIFHRSKVTVFSATEMVGFKEGNSSDLSDNWFSHGAAPFDSLLTFSFTGEGEAEEVLRQVNEFNQTHPGKFPVRAFIVPVEKSTDTSSLPGAL
jgi:hypothetical protein